MRALLNRVAALVVVLGFVAACAPDPVGEPRGAGDRLDQVDAEARALMVGNVSYDIDLDLIGDPQAYSGSVTIAFDYSPGDSALTIDFGGGEVRDIDINGAAASVDYNGFFITLPAGALETGRNEVRIAYRHVYDRDGTGLHRFTDPEDGRTYLYTYLWPYYANRLFPSFDQPNIKATYRLQVRAAPDWTVISSVREAEVEDDGDARLWTFADSEKFSTYIFSLHAGPYAVWEGQAGDIPIRLFARQSLAPYVAAEEWLDFTRAGLAFYADYFDIPYAFHKYDQVIVPDFNIGAMENVAAVTFAESYVQRGPSNRFQSENRAGVILHEMAHMWFGDLVTKDWWNGLWLNESFATYMAAMAVVEATEFSDAWHDFYLGSKRSAFAADGLVTTHPIEVPVPSTADFFAIFDSITYGKGASVLKQLGHFIGPDEFRAGVSAYLKKHAYGNTRLEDFIAALSDASGRDLNPWAQEWLYHAGANRIEARYRCEAGAVAAFSILQTAPEDLPTLRDHRLQIGLYRQDGDAGVETIAVLPANISGPETSIDQAVGLPCPDMVHPNHGDWGYAQVTLDRRTLDNLEQMLSGIADPLSRSMYWQALWDMTQGGALGFDDFLDLVLAHLPGDANARVMRQVLGDLSSALALLDRLSPEADDTKAAYGPRVEQMMWRKIQQSGLGADALTLWFDAYVDEARGAGALDKLAGLLSGDLVAAGIVLDRDRRWAIIQRLNAMGFAGADQLLAAEAAADGSDAGQRMAIAAQAAQPGIEAKRHWLEVFHDPENPLPLSKQRAAMVALFPSHQSALQGTLMAEILSPLAELGATRDAYFLSSYGITLLNGVCEDDAIAQLAGALGQAAQLDTTILRFLREAHQRAGRCLALRHGMTAAQ